MRSRLMGLALALIAGASAVRAEPPAALALPADSLLAALIAESLAARPELAAARAEQVAREERVPAAGALPDPMLEVGLQNDGFERLEIGSMEQSSVTLMAAQTLPWPGKRGLREEAAALAAQSAASVLERAALDTEAAVRGAYLELRLARARLALLARLQSLWVQATAVAEARYAAGTGAQLELLRAQLEGSRLAQRRALLLAAERQQVQALNRLCGRPLDTPIAIGAEPSGLALAPRPAPAEILAASRAASPELAAARLALSAAESGRALAARERWPDLVLKAGLMPRGGDFDPMWTLSLGATLPLFAGRKQNRLLAASEAEQLARRHELEALEQALALRVAEREALLVALAETIRLYETGLLQQSTTLTESALAGYAAGTLGFAALAEASAGRLADEDGYLASLAEAQRLAIAAAAISLTPAPTPGVSLAAPAMGGMAAMPAAPARGEAMTDQASPAPPGAASPAPTPMPGM
ncbi:TolC family protein [bacterium]|nr:TolC family protein [bacterium]